MIFLFDLCFLFKSTSEELDADIDCLKLAKIHANIRVKLVFENHQVNRNEKFE